MTTGAEPDPDGYTAVIDSDPDWMQQWRELVDPNGSAEFTLPAKGPLYYTASLSGIAPNCTTALPGENFAVGDSASTTLVTLAVKCLAIPPTQGVRVTNVTTGTFPDTATFLLLIDSDTGAAQPFHQSRLIGANESVTMPSPPGSFEVSLNNVAHWHLCSQPGVQRVRVESNLMSSLRFNVACAP